LYLVLATLPEIEKNYHTKKKLQRKQEVQNIQT